MNDLLHMFVDAGAVIVVACVIYIAHRTEQSARELRRIREVLERDPAGPPSESAER